MTAVMLSVSMVTANIAEARLKYYRYNANIPMVEMTLNMMVAMGVLEQIPGRLVHDGNPYNRLARVSHGRYSRSPYAVPVDTGYLDSPGYYDAPGYYDDLVYDNYRGRINPYTGYYSSPYGYGGRYSSWDSPWGEPWGDQWGNPWNTTWGSPWNSTWGNPYNVYGNQWNTPWNSLYGNQWNTPWSNLYGSQWNTPWNSLYGNPWNTPYNSLWGNPLNYPWSGAGNNPWLSPWSSTVINPFASPYGVNGWTGVPGYSGLSTLPGYSLPGYSQGNTSVNTQGNRPASSPADDSRPGNAPYRSDTPYRSDMPYRPDMSRSNAFSIDNISAVGSAGLANSPYQPSDGRFDREQGKGKSDGILNGLWIGERGEMLGIRGGSFLIYDGKDRYANGELVMTRTMLKATLEGSNREFSMHYRLIGNRLYTVSGGKTRLFNRSPLLQQPALGGMFHASPSSYHSDAAASFATRSKNRAESIAAPVSDAFNASDSAASSLSQYRDQPTETRAALRYRGEKSPTWGPASRSAAETGYQDLPARGSGSRHSGSGDTSVENATRAAATAFAAMHEDKGPDSWSWLSVQRPDIADSAVSNSATRRSTPQDYQASIVKFQQDYPVAWPSVPDFRADEAEPDAEAASGGVSAPFGADSASAGVPGFAAAGRPLQRRQERAAGSADRRDASFYLFSYLKDQNRSVSVEDSGNIWKPTKAFADRQRNQRASGSYYSWDSRGTAAEKPDGYRVRKFVWAENRGLD